MNPARSNTTETSKMEAAPIRENSISATTALNIPIDDHKKIRGTDPNEGLDK
jgi:hypothetical protein